MNTPTKDKTLTTADFAAAADQRDASREEQPAQRGERREGEPGRDMGRDPDAGMREMGRDANAGMRDPNPDYRHDAEIRQDRMPQGAAGAQGEQLAPLFLPQVAEGFRARWDEVQIGFVDDPREAVKKADELVAQVMKSLAETFADERANIEGQVDQSDTEQMRVALHRYRSFFQRLLTL